MQRDGHDEGGPVFRSQGQRLAAKDYRLDAGGESPLQLLADEGVLVGAEIAGAGALAVLADGRQVERIGIAGDEIFEQAGYLGGADGVFNMVEQAGEGQDLPFADELLIEVGVEKLDLFAHRTGELRFAARFPYR